MIFDHVEATDLKESMRAFVSSRYCVAIDYVETAAHMTGYHHRACPFANIMNTTRLLQSSLSIADFLNHPETKTPSNAPRHPFLSYVCKILLLSQEVIVHELISLTGLSLTDKVCRVIGAFITQRDSALVQGILKHLFARVLSTAKPLIAQELENMLGLTTTMSVPGN